MRVLQLTYKAGEVKIKQFTTLAAALGAHHTSLLSPLFCFSHNIKYSYQILTCAHTHKWWALHAMKATK